MDTYEEKDKYIAAYLMALEDVSFTGTKAVGDVVYFQFSPAEKARNYGEQFLAKSAMPIQPKDFVDAIGTVTRLIWRNRNSRDGYGGSKYEYK